MFLFDSCQHLRLYLLVKCYEALKYITEPCQSRSVNVMLLSQCLAISFVLSLTSAKVRSYFGVKDTELNSVPLFLILVSETIVLKSDIDGSGNKSILQWW